MKIGATILAAGESARMGTPKQLLQYEKTNFLRHAVDAAIGSPVDITAVVLGAHFHLILPQLKGKPVNVIMNDQWSNGIGTSIRSGVNYFLTEHVDVAAVVLMVCDQPFVTSQTITALINEFKRQETTIVACWYRGFASLPAIFHRRLFGELLQLDDDSGPRPVILRHQFDSSAIEFPEAGFDVDTPLDYERLAAKNKT